MSATQVPVRALATIVTLTFSGLAIAAALEGGLEPDSASCSEGVISRLYLGQATPSGAVTDAQWQGFVADSVTPRFPAGFTELRADGRWRDERGVVIEERTRVIEVAHDEARASRQRIRAIAADYRYRFAQQSVLVTQSRTVYCFDREVAVNAKGARLPAARSQSPEQDADSGADQAIGNAM